MKKIAYLLLAATSLVFVASCVKEIAPEQALTASQGGQEFTISLPAATRTDLVEGKTVWAKGDSIWVSNGTTSESIVVPAEAYGKKEFSFVAKEVFITEATPKLYIVYPYTAASAVKDGKIQVKVPAQQKGEFATANIAAAVTEDYTIDLKNVTSVLKMTIPEVTKTQIYSLTVSAAPGNALCGTCTVDLSGETPVVTPPTTPGTDVTVNVAGIADDYYVAVIPGKFDAGFKLMAATTDFAYASETKVSTAANTLKVNDLVDLGSIGGNLQPLSGDGTEASPYLLESIGHVIAFAGAVENGESFEGKFVKLGADIEGITTPIGSQTVTYSNSTYTIGGKPFKGTFDGAGHTLTVDITAASSGRSQWVGLFGGLGDGAVVKNLTIAGSVSVGGCNNIGGLAGSVYSDTKGVTISNVTNKAYVKGNNTIGGLIGLASANVKNLLVIDNCHNEGKIDAGSYGVGGIIGRSINKEVERIVKNCTNSGAVSGQYAIGGIVGYSYYTPITDCSNSGSITGTADGAGVYGVFSGKFTWSPSTGTGRGVGGVVGWQQTGGITSCKNTGTIKGITKVGGIAGSTYFCTVSKSTNSGDVTATGSINATLSAMSMAGGIVGFHYCAYNIVTCENSGTITGKGCVGGIVGYHSSGSTSNTIELKVNDCTNTGKVVGNGQAVGGICGMTMSINGSRWVHVFNCVNKGDVENASTATGGIVGTVYEMNNAGKNEINNCVNEGNVKGTIWSGGIVGYCQSRATKSGYNIWNCINKGDVLTTRSDKDGGDVGGGLVGAVDANIIAGASYGLFLKNSINYGKVQYSVVSHVNPYIGGVVGRMCRGTIENTVNAGAIGPKTGSPAAGAENYLGTLVGSLENDAVLKNSYFAQDIYPQVVGKAKVQPDVEKNSLVAYDEWGMLDGAAVIGSTTAFLVDEALQAWVTANKDRDYCTWTWTTKPELDLTIK